MEVINMDKEVKAQLTKLVSVRLCAPVPGQALMALVTNPPQPGDPSHAQFMKVKTCYHIPNLFGTLATFLITVTEIFNPLFVVSSCWINIILAS